MTKERVDYRYKGVCGADWAFTYIDPYLKKPQAGVPVPQIQ